MIEFNCSQCGHPIRVPESAAGKRGNCNECGALLRIPDAPDKPLSDTNSATESAVENPDRAQKHILNMFKDPQVIFFSCFLIGIALLVTIRSVTKETTEEARIRILEELRKQDEPYLNRIKKETEEKLEKLDRQSEQMKKMVENISETNQKLIEEQYRKNMQEIDRKAKIENERFIRDFQNEFGQQNR